MKWLVSIRGLKLRASSSEIISVSIPR